MTGSVTRMVRFTAGHVIFTSSTVRLPRKTKGGEDMMTDGKNRRTNGKNCFQRDESTVW